MIKLIVFVLYILNYNISYAEQKLTVYSNVDAIVIVKNSSNKVIARDKSPISCQYSGRTWIKVIAFNPNANGKDKSYFIREFNIHDLEQNYNPVFMVYFCPDFFHGPPRVIKRINFEDFDQFWMCCNCCYGNPCTSHSRCKRNLRWNMHRPEVREVRGFKFKSRKFFIQRKPKEPERIDY